MRTRNLCFNYISVLMPGNNFHGWREPCTFLAYLNFGKLTKFNIPRFELDIRTQSEICINNNFKNCYFFQWNVGLFVIAKFQMNRRFYDIFLCASRKRFSMWKNVIRSSANGLCRQMDSKIMRLKQNNWSVYGFEVKRAEPKRPASCLEKITMMTFS